MYKSVLFPLAAIALLLSCHTPETSRTTTSPFTREALAARVAILASDSFQGRKPFSVGEERTTAYLQKEFASLGLEPGNGKSYFQDVPMVEIFKKPDPQMRVDAGKTHFDLQSGKDYVLSTESTDSLASLNRDELVFAGYGVVAPEYHWNDYANINVKGKVVLVMVNDPGFGTDDTTLFKGKAMTYYGRWTYKFEEAARQGAKGCLIIHNTAAASYPFSVVQSSWESASLYLDERSNPVYHCPVEGWVSGEAAHRLLAAAGKDSSLLMSANTRGFKAVALGEKLTTKMRISTIYKDSKNVIARITGTKHPDEYIIYTAHWDHFGISQPDKRGDSIYNGAVDNASGTAALLEIAAAFQRAKIKPERTILFLSVTAEEQGLLGSEYYATHPLYPLNKTVADLNMDMVSPNEKTNDIVIAGSGQNDLEDYIDSAARQAGLYLASDDHPEAGFYFRSDHFSFAKRGVPAVSTANGIDIVGQGKAYGRKLYEDYEMNHYHKPADEYDSSWTFGGGLQVMDILYRVGQKLASGDEWPGWKAGSEFKSIRDRQRGSEQ